MDNRMGAPMCGLMERALVLAALTSAGAGALTARADDWPMFGRNKMRNALSPERNPPTDWQVAGKDDNGLERPARNLKWQTLLGSGSMGGPVVANGLVWVGTNNDQPRDPTIKGDRAVLMCFRESDGKFLYQYVSPRLPDPVQDWPGGSLAAPLVEGDRVWFVNNRCETVCLDVGALRRGKATATPVWKADMIRDLHVQSRATRCTFKPPPSSIGAAYKDLIYVVTGNGVDEERASVPVPHAPSVVCFNKLTGKVVWTDNSPGKEILYLHCLDSRTGKVHWVHDLKAAVWGSPLWVDGKIFVPTEDGDVWIYSHGKELREPKKIEMGFPIRASPVFANGVLYVPTESRLYAIQEKK